MLLKADIKRFYILSIGILIVSLLSTFFLPDYAVLSIPALLGVACFYLLSLENTLLLIAFCTPFSVEIFFGSSGINIPNEPLMIIFTGILALKILENKAAFKAIWISPLALLISIDFIWLLVTTFSSSLPIVSVKYLLAHTWFVSTGFLWGLIIFQNIENIKRFVIAFGLSLSAVVIYTTVRHWQHSFSQKSGTYVMNPFFSDHTVYSAVCCVIFVFALIMLLENRKQLSVVNKLAFTVISTFSLIGIVFSYSRAAWVSLIVTFAFSIILKLKIKFYWLISTLVVLALVGILFQNQIYQQLKNNKVASGKDLQSDIKSISNIKTDESNVERLNRWEAGKRMFTEKPMLGFGPGTYQFLYSPYQRPHQMTSISTTTGDMGGIHSEYFRPLVESGVIGLLTFLMIVLWFIKNLMNIFYHNHDPVLKVYSKAVLLSLMSYFIHGTLNNFLNQDKSALLFWAFLGMAAALHQNKSLSK